MIDDTFVLKNIITLNINLSFNPIRPVGKADLPPPSHIRVYACDYMHPNMLIFVTFSMEEVTNNFTLKNASY